MSNLVFTVIAICAFSSGVIGQTTTGSTDPIAPLITFLAQLQKLRELYTTARTSQNALAPIPPTATTEPRTPSVLSFLQSTTDSQPVALNSVSTNTPNNGDGVNYILTPGNNNNNNAGASLTIQLPSSFGRASAARPTSDIQRVNQGLSDILEGVRTASLERILRGSFSFTRNNNVRSVADTVINSLFSRQGRGRAQNSINDILNSDTRG